MGLDLKLLPAYEEGDCAFSLSQLSFDRNYEFFEALKAKDKYLIQERLLLRTTQGNQKEDAYGDRLTFIYADNLKTFLKGYEFEHWRNRAIKRYINELPDNLKVWLYWC